MTTPTFARKSEVILLETIDRDGKTVQLEHRPAGPYPDYRGSGPGRFVRGRRATPADLRVGQLFIQDSHWFRATNIVRITQIPDTPGEKAYGIYVDPKETSRARTGSNGHFCIWHDDLSEARRATGEFFIAEEP